MARHSHAPKSDTGAVRRTQRQPPDARAPAAVAGCARRRPGTGQGRALRAGLLGRRDPFGYVQPRRDAGAPALRHLEVRRLSLDRLGRRLHRLEPERADARAAGARRHARQRQATRSVERLPVRQDKPPRRTRRERRAPPPAQSQQVPRTLGRPGLRAHLGGAGTRARRQLAGPAADPGARGGRRRAARRRAADRSRGRAEALSLWRRFSRDALCRRRVGRPPAVVARVAALVVVRALGCGRRRESSHARQVRARACLGLAVVCSRRAARGTAGADLGLPSLDRQRARDAERRTVGVLDLRRWVSIECRGKPPRGLCRTSPQRVARSRRVARPVGAAERLSLFCRLAGLRRALRRALGCACRRGLVLRCAEDSIRRISSVVS